MGVSGPLKRSGKDPIARNILKRKGRKGIFSGLRGKTE